MTTRLFAKRRHKRFGFGRRLALASAALLLFLGAAYLVQLQLFGNFHPVVAGEFYRSAQLTPEKIEELQPVYGFKTIVNLRGPNAGRAWYEAERQTASKLGIRHIDFGLSAVRGVTPEKAAELLDLLRRVEKPVLVHCKAGADRAGLASALYLAGAKKASPDVARGQLSFRFGHIGLPFLREYEMDRSLEAFLAVSPPSPLLSAQGLP